MAAARSATNDGGNIKIVMVGNFQQIAIISPMNLTYGNGIEKYIEENY